jgi:glyoxylase I family protein
VGVQLLGVHHIAVIASDYQRSKSFYIDRLGFELRSEVHRAERDSWMGDLALNGTYVLELFSFPSPPPRPTGPEALGLRHLAFAVEDVHAAVAELAAAGVRCEEVRTDPHTGADMVFFFDPDGLPLELYQA